MYIISRKDFLFQLAEELVGKEKKDQQNIDYNQPSPRPSPSQECKNRQIAYCKRNRSNNTCKM